MLKQIQMSLFSWLVNEWSRGDDSAEGPQVVGGGVRHLLARRKAPNLLVVPPPRPTMPATSAFNPS